MPSTKKTTAVVLSKVPAETKQLDTYLEQAHALKIEGDDDMKDATTFLSVLNKFSDKITGEKERVTKPLNQALKVERERWKPLETKLDEAISLTRRAMTSYQTAAVKKQKEEENNIAKRVGEGRGKLSMETAVKRMDAIETPETTVATDAGAVQFRTVQKFEIMDITLVPHDFLLPNEVKMRETMKAGIPIPGVRYYEEQVPYNTR